MIVSRLLGEGFAMCRLSGCLFALGVILADPVSAQGEKLRNVEQNALPDGGSSDEIIVKALSLPRDKLPVNVRWAPVDNTQINIAYERADTFLGCAFAKASRDWLRKAVEGPPDFASTRYAQGMVIQTHWGCYPPPGDRPAWNPAEMGGSFLHRGILLERTLRQFAPDASLDAAQTFDPKVRARFRKVETEHNRYRQNPEMSGYIVAACLVQTQPVLATRLVRSQQGSDLERGLEQAVLVNSTECLEGVKKLSIEPTTLRLYLVDAFYRWVLAARNVSTLIPEQGV